MKITRLTFPAVLFLFAIFIWPIGASVLAMTATMDVSVKKGLSAVDTLILGLVALGTVSWMGVRWFGA